MKSCTFFGHIEGEHTQVEAELYTIIAELVENYNVTKFYIGGRTKFDRLCADTVYRVKEDHPQIELIQVIWNAKEELKEGQVCFLDKEQPVLSSIFTTHRILIDKVDFIVSGIKKDRPFLKEAIDYATLKNKEIIDAYDFWNSSFYQKIEERLAPTLLSPEEKAKDEKILENVLNTIRQRASAEKS